MWTKRYLTKPTKEEYFKTKHPVAIVSLLLPLGLYYLFCLIKGLNSWWIMAGVAGCLVFGVGLGYAFAVKVKIYSKPILPILCLMIGGMVIASSLIFSL